MALCQILILTKLSSIIITYCHNCHFIDEEMESKSGLVICPKSQRSQDSNLGGSKRLQNEAALLYLRAPSPSAQTSFHVPTARLS